MKNCLALTLLTLLTLGGFAYADIQSPPGHHYNWSRKLSRGTSNILYGWTEPFDVYRRTLRSEGSIAAASDFLIEGPKRILVRLGYGVYEVATFPVPSYKLTYRPPYYRKENVDPWWGYKDFVPELGFVSNVDYSRTQDW